MLDYRYPLSIKRFASLRQQREPTEPFHRNASVGQPSDRDKGHIELGIGKKQLVGTEIEPNGLLQHAINVMFIVEFSFGLACVVEVF